MEEEVPMEDKAVAEEALIRDEAAEEVAPKEVRKFRRKRAFSTA